LQKKLTKKELILLPIRLKNGVHFTEFHQKNSKKSWNFVQTEKIFRQKSHYFLSKKMAN